MADLLGLQGDALNSDRLSLEFHSLVVHVVVSGQLLEVLRVLEGRVEREEDVQRLDPGFVDRDVKLELCRGTFFWVPCSKFKELLLELRSKDHLKKMGAQ